MTPEPTCIDCRRHDLACLTHADPLADNVTRCQDCQRRHATIGDRCDRCHEAAEASRAEDFTPAAVTPYIVDRAIIPAPTPRSMDDLTPQARADLATARRRLARRNNRAHPERW